MRWLLDKVRTRLGVAMGLTIVVVGVVAIGKLGGARPEQPIYRADTAAPVPSVDLSAGDDSVDDPGPTAVADDGIVLDVAEDFARAWLRRDLTTTAWHTAVSSMTAGRAMDGP